MPNIELLIAGCGVSGKAAATLAATLHKEYVILDETDSTDIREFIAKLPFPPADILIPWNAEKPLPYHFHTAVMSPGIRRTSPIFRCIADAADKMTGELLFAAANSDCPMIGITGTNGKTTVTELTTALFRAVGKKADAAGNIGAGLSNAVLAYQDGKVELLIVEISSFQLENANTFPVEAAAVLNLASDHIDRHGSMEEYARLKFILANSAKKAVVLNSNLDEYRRKYLHSSVSVITFSATTPDADFTLSEKRIIHYRGKPVFDCAKTALKGNHNVENIMAALALLISIEGEQILSCPEITRALASFKPSAHRLECFLQQNNISYIDDSKATNPHAVNAALDFYGQNKNILILLGGLDKNMDFRELIPHLSNARKVYLTGACREQIKTQLQNHCEMEIYPSFSAAVQAMCAEAKSGDTVMLSPATASMDEFKNYKERGNRFQELVRQYVSKENPE